MNLRAILLGQGRLNRRQFVIIFILLVLIEYCAGGIIDKFFSLNEEGYLSDFGEILYVIIVFIIGFLITSILIRRGHDIGIKKGGVFLPYLHLFLTSLTNIIAIPSVAVILGMAISGSEIGVYFMFLFIYGSLIVSAIFYIYCIVIAFIKGKNDINNYGKKAPNLLRFSEILKFWITNNY